MTDLAERLHLEAEIERLRKALEETVEVIIALESKWLKDGEGLDDRLGGLESALYAVSAVIRRALDQESFFLDGAHDDS